MAYLTPVPAGGERSTHDHQRLRPVQGGHRAVELAHGRPDARGLHLRVPAARRGPAGTCRRGPLRALRVAGGDRARARQRQGRRPRSRGGATRPGGPRRGQPRVDAVRREGKLLLAGEHVIAFSVDDDVVLHRRKRLEFHSNGLLFRALDAEGGDVLRREYYSVGGGFVLDEDDAGNPAIVEDPTPVPYPFHTGEELLAR